MNYDNLNIKIYVLAEDYSGYNSLFLAQHGVSFLIETETKGKNLKILFDTATYAEPILSNMKILNIDPKTIDMIVLSHSHFDHTGGLLKIMKEINKEIPIFAHPDIFKDSFIEKPQFEYVGIPYPNEKFKKEIEEFGGKWILSKDPIFLSNNIFTLGEIKTDDRVDFEKHVSINIKKINKDGHITQDEVQDEIGLGIIIKNKLVVLGGCSHPGIISMIEKAVKVSGKNDVYAVIGGFHLIDSDNNRLQKTINALEKKDIDKIFTGHCTGFEAECALSNKFRDRFEKLHSGKIITLDF